MTRVSSREARAGFSEIVNRARYAHERTVITSNGKDVAALISVDDLKLLEATLNEIENSMDIEAARAALADYEEHGGALLEEAIERLGLK